MDEQRMFVAGESTAQWVAFPIPQSAPLAQVFPWLAPASPSLSFADEFALFADESLDWAEFTFSATLENWPDE